MRPAVAGVPAIDEARCFGCGHCGAICGPGAIESPSGEFVAWQAPDIGAADVKSFLSGRRSVRRYCDTPLSHGQIEELLSIAPYAPTASHAQDVQATVLTGKRVYELATEINDYYRWFERLLARRALWPLLWLTSARPYLSNHNKLDAIRRRARAFDRRHDWIFFGAPAVVVLSAPRSNAGFGRVNCVIAAERILQYASALGYGSCLIGHAEVALRNRPKIARSIALDPALEPQVVFTIGLPAVHYRRLPARSPLAVSWLPERETAS